jgi:hypothetical protein
MTIPILPGDFIPRIRGTFFLGSPRKLLWLDDPTFSWLFEISRDWSRMRNGPFLVSIKVSYL